MANTPLEKMAPIVLYTKIQHQRRQINNILDNFDSLEKYSKEQHRTRANFWGHWYRLKRILKIFNKRKNLNDD
jgi:hypothetical protein